MSYLLENGRITSGREIPKLSTALDSVRTFQFEVTFHNLPQGVEVGDAKPLTLAAKQISNMGFMSEDIEVNRGNDKLYFPGKVSYDEMLITFDHQYMTRTAKSLYEYMQYTFDPLTGEITKGQGFNTVKNHKGIIDVTQLVIVWVL